MTLPIDRTTKAALDANLVNGITSDAPVLKANNDVIYNTIDEQYNRFQAFLAGYNRFIDGGMFTETGIANTYDGGAF